jgi:hypothetical protein
MVPVRLKGIATNARVMASAKMSSRLILSYRA